MRQHHPQTFLTSVSFLFDATGSCGCVNSQRAVDKDVLRRVHGKAETALMLPPTLSRNDSHAPDQPFGAFHENAGRRCR